jgi:hypothetical protein
VGREGPLAEPRSSIGKAEQSKVSHEVWLIVASRGREASFVSFLSFHGF